MVTEITKIGKKYYGFICPICGAPITRDIYDKDLRHSKHFFDKKECVAEFNRHNHRRYSTHLEGLSWLDKYTPTFPPPAKICREKLGVTTCLECPVTPDCNIKE